MSTPPSFPSLNGLVLAGGKSTRMGTAKQEICWHGKEQQYSAADLLAKFCDEVFISCRPDQLEKVNAAYPTIPDAFAEIGPLGGILSALRFQRDRAWLVVACDIPLLDENALDFLVRSRDPEKAATVYTSPLDGGPEPLVAIWEPESYKLLLNFLETGSRSPRKFLMNSDVFMLPPENPQVLRNVNTPEEAAEVKRMMEMYKNSR